MPKTTDLRIRRNKQGRLLVLLPDGYASLAGYGHRDRILWNLETEPDGSKTLKLIKINEDEEERGEA